MPESAGDKPYDLEERTYQFAKRVALFCKKLPQNLVNREYVGQVVRASASVAANYIEANEALSRKDFVMRIKICRKESKESAMFLRLIHETNPPEFSAEGLLLQDEAVQLKKIFASILLKT